MPKHMYNKKENINAWSDGQTSGDGQTKAESERGRAPLILHRESRKSMGFTW